jgi:hypothetical protein
MIRQRRRISHLVKVKLIVRKVGLVTLVMNLIPLSSVPSQGVYYEQFISDARDQACSLLAFRRERR